MAFSSQVMIYWTRTYQTEPLDGIQHGRAEPNRRRIGWLRVEYRVGMICTVQLPFVVVQHVRRQVRTAGDSNQAR